MVAAIHAFLMKSLFGIINRVYSGLFLLELLQIQGAHQTGQVVLQKELPSNLSFVR